MTPIRRHLQLHLFDIDPERVSIPPETRRRLLALLVVLLGEAASDEASGLAPTSNTEAGHE
jgi:hypothetical protein